MNFQEKLSGVVARYEEVQALLSTAGISADELVKLNKEMSTLEPVVEAITNYQKMERSFKEAEELKDDKILSIFFIKLSVVILHKT